MANPLGYVFSSLIVVANIDQPSISYLTLLVFSALLYVTQDCTSRPALPYGYSMRAKGHMRDVGLQYIVALAMFGQVD